jgi:hypothetical protein
MKIRIGAALLVLLLLGPGSAALAGRKKKNTLPPPPHQFALKMFHELEITVEDCPADLVSEVTADPTRGLVCGTGFAGTLASFQTRWNRLSDIRVREFGFESAGGWKEEIHEGATLHVRKYFTMGADWLTRVEVDDRVASVVVTWMGPPE